MKNFEPTPWFFIILTGVVALAVGIGLVAAVIVDTPTVTGEDIDRIVREVQDADENGDKAVMVNVQVAAGFGIIQRAESTQALTDTDTTSLVLPEDNTPGLPTWQLILLVAAAFLPLCALGCWLMFDR